MVASRRVQLEPAFLLHQKQWRDSSRIVDFLTRDHGRVTLFAKGVRRAGSHWQAVLLPFGPLVISWSGSGDGGTLTGAEVGTRPVPVAPSCLMSAFYLNELVLKLLGREDSHPDVHDAYALALAALASPADEHRGLRLFEKRLLEAIGVGLDYAHLVDGGARVEPDRYYHVNPARGVTAEAADPFLPSVCRGADLLSLGGEDLSTPASVAVARRVLRAAINTALDGKELSSRRVARAVQERRTGKEESRR